MIEILAHELTATGGTREANEDATIRVSPEDPLVRERKGHLLAVADGLGGHEAGHVASATAIQGLVDTYYASTSPSRVEPALQRAIQAANLRVHEVARQDSRYRSMQSTLSCLALAGGSAYLGHVGDSRIYRCRAGVLTQLTSDHSEAAELVRLRLAKPDSLVYHPRRNVLTRTIGSQLLLRPDFQRLAVAPDDVFVLCSDGLWSEVSDDEIARAVSELEPESACEELVGLQLGRASLDNVTVQVVRVLAVDAAPAESEHWLNSLVTRLVGPRPERSPVGD